MSLFNRDPMSNGDWLMVCLVIAYVVILSVYATEANWPKVLYWFGATCITTAVLWMK